MLGAIFGDIAGSVYEFRNTHNYHFTLLCKDSQPTDDSYMTLAVAKALMDTYGMDDETIKQALVKEMQRIGHLHPDAGYGGRFYYWLQAEQPEPYNSFGNGSGMRVSAAGWMYDTLEETLHAAELTACVTHNHPEGIKGAQAIASAIFLARTKHTKEEIRAYIAETFDYDLNRTLDEIRPTYAFYEICQKSLRNLARNRAENGIRSQIIGMVPTKPETEFPKALEMKRHFILHIGPTNCGKTYHALESLKQAMNGVYLGPLRLLALEVYEKMNDAGIPCTMLTGEERIYQENSFITASTIEMLDIEQEYDIAVIDEAQMIADPDRGHSWTRAILGVQAKEIHICMSPAAEKVVKHLIALCGDTEETNRYERKTKLLCEETPFGFPVEPDVTMMYWVSSPVTQPWLSFGLSSAVSGSVAASSTSGAQIMPSSWCPAAAASSLDVATRIEGAHPSDSSISSHIVSTRLCGMLVCTGTKACPARRQARREQSMSGHLRPRTITGMRS